MSSFVEIPLGFRSQLQHSVSRACFRLNIRDMQGSFERSQEKMLTLLADAALEADLSQGIVRSGPEGLARRFLPPGKIMDLYNLYVSYQIAAKQASASATTFCRVFREGWRHCLRFRGKSTHSACPICQKLKSDIRHARRVQAHAQASDRLLRHLSGQFMDRQVYWALRSRAKTSQDILVAITDSMDKGKFLLPRYPEGRVPKNIADLERPCCEVTTTIIHGRVIYTAVGDQGQTHGSSWTCECLSRALDVAFGEAQRKAKAWPAILKVFADNTCKALFSRCRASCVAALARVETHTRSVIQA